jgi:hypothetical protein
MVALLRIGYIILNPEILRIYLFDGHIIEFKNSFKTYRNSLRISRYSLCELLWNLDKLIYSNSKISNDLLFLSKSLISLDLG